MHTHSRSTIYKVAAALVAVVLVGSCSSDPSENARTITITFVRHAQSEGNASGVINTAVPGPGITPEGREQAEAVADELSRNDYDGIYASTMVRTQQTAAPMSQALGETVEVLPGLREIEAGWFEGEPEAAAATTYMIAPVDWLEGDLAAQIPGSINGTEFNDRFTQAVQKIYDSGDAKPIAFSHGAAIMVWTLMNVKNPKTDLLTYRPLPNTGEVVITGNPGFGWTLQNWDGLKQTQ